MARPAGALSSGRRRRARCGRADALDFASSDRVPRGAMRRGKGKGEGGKVDKHDLETPALLLHLDVVERNVKHMAERAKRLGVKLRPHAKTHKCVELGRLQLEHGAHGLTVATTVEAEVFARAGLNDITWAFPLDPGHIARVRRLAQQTGVTLRVVVDDLATARALAESGLHAWLKVDCGYHRAGVDPSAPYALAVARELGRERGITFDGILRDRKSTRLNSSHITISYAVFCLKKKKNDTQHDAVDATNT